MKNIIIVLLSIVVLIGMGVGFYMWYFDDNKYVYDYANLQQNYQDNSYQDNSYQNNFYQDNSYQNNYSTNNANNENNTSIDNLNNIKNETILDAKQDNNISTEKQIVENNTSKALDETQNIEKKPQQANKIEEQKTIDTTENKTIQKPQQDKEKTKAKETKFKSTMHEYIAKGKTSRYEERLSNDFVKVYVLDGKILSDYRIDMLKEMINPIQENSQDYNLTIFVKMLANDNMNLSIYNKDIVFEKNKNKYKYIGMKISDLKFLFDKNAYADFSNDDLLKQISQKLSREDVIKRIKIQGYTDDRGSSFANYMIGLNRAMNAAKYFFTFTEVIEIQSLGKDTYPNKDKSDTQRQNNRKIEISFL